MNCLQPNWRKRNPTPGAASRQWEHQRLEVLAQLHQGACPLLVATVEGLLQRTMPPAVFAAHCRQLTVGQVCQLEELSDFLARAGYTRCDQVEGVGQFSLRGGILDVFSPGRDLPVRLEFWGDEIDSMGLFDVSSQQRTVNLREAEILPEAAGSQEEGEEESLLMLSEVNLLATGGYEDAKAVVDALNEKSFCLRVEHLQIDFNSENDYGDEARVSATVRIYGVRMPEEDLGFA